MSTVIDKPAPRDRGTIAEAVAAEQPFVAATNLVKYFAVSRGVLVSRRHERLHAVDDVSFQIARGEVLGIVGETGCGKSTLARLVMRLIDPTSGTIMFDGRDITRLSRQHLRPLRREMQMIFQDPYSALNPRRTVGAIIGEPLRIHGIGTKEERRGQVREVMALVGLNPEHWNRYPHEFSGGQRQRIGVGRAIITRPKLIVADEPVSALDVSIQAQMLNLLQDLRERMQLTMIFIAHDLSVVRHVSDRVAVMYLGKIVEIATPERLYDRPRHPYSAALLSAVPVPRSHRRGRPHRLVLKGDVPSPTRPPSGCRFRTRCLKAQEICAAVEPPLAAVDAGDRLVACHFPLDDEEAFAAVARFHERQGLAVWEWANASQADSREVGR